MWKQIEGYKWPYRINEEGEIQKFYQGGWVDLHPYLHGARAHVKMRTADNRKVDVAVVWLMADAFMGGRREGYAIIHKDGMKLNNALWNLAFVSIQECGKMSAGARRKAVLKIDRDGNVVEIFRSGREAARKEYVAQNCISERCLNLIKNPYELTGYNYQYESNYGESKRGRRKKETT